ncbi:MAG: hypothetical protein IPM45_03960 [Acidimicrobiales bacterium]|nr:hypothetical protein [Acidimicrobiales bacterium]
MSLNQPTDPLIPSQRIRRRLASIEAAAIAGIVCAVGWAIALRGLLSVPGIGASDKEINEYYADTSNATAAIVWLQILVVSTIAFLWFVGVVRGRLGDREPRLFGTVFFGSSVLLAGLLFAGTALLAAPSVLLAVGDRSPDPETVSVFRAGAAVVLSVFAPRIATLVMLSTASLGRATGALPGWLVVLTYVIGVIAFVNISIATPTVYAVPAWIALVSIVLLVRRPPQGFGLEPVSGPAAG